MDRLVLHYPDGHQAHSCPGHPERPERVEAIREVLVEAGWWDPFSKLHPLTIPNEILQTVHTPAYLSVLEMSCQRGSFLDMDTYTTSASWDLAHNAAGGAAAVAQAVWGGEAQRGFALSRPPGHHATRGQGMGFCLLNNIAIAAEYLIKEAGTRRLAIVDLDLHHGNGTQDIFWDRADVFYISTHQSPLYPGTGRIDEKGGGKGEGYTANFPLPPYSGDHAFQAVMQDLVLPLLDRFSPEMILVSYGFDTHWLDPLGSLLLSANGYRDIVAYLVNWADQHCKGRICLFLEGGYDLEAARACSLAVVSALLGLDWHDPLGPAPQSEGRLWQNMVQYARNLWEL
jgi:acetoin utilization deacetylase AcuC-like enzyme